MTRMRSRPDSATSCRLQAGTPLSRGAVDTSIECTACGAQVPASTATALEGVDYLWHFCGHDCLSRWCEKIEQEQAACSCLLHGAAAGRREGDA